MLNKVLTCIAFAVLVVNISACANGALFRPVEKIPEGKALVYFYREHALAGVLIDIDLSVNGKQVGSVSDEGYFYYFVAPGKIVVTEDRNDNGLILTVEESKTYFVKTGMRGGGGMSTIKRILELTSSDIALLEIPDNHLDR